MTPVRVLLVDDQALFREALGTLLATNNGITIVGEAGNGEEALARAAELAPEVVLMDLRMPVLDGVAATKRLRLEHPGVRVIALTTFDDDEDVFAALRAGAVGYLLKDAEPDELLNAVRVVAAGEGMLAPTVTRRLIATFADGGPPPTPEAETTLAGLTAREREVFVLLASGLSNAELADQLGVGVGTVKTHVNALLNKLGVRDRVRATILAYDLGIVRTGGHKPDPAQ